MQASKHVLGGAALIALSLFAREAPACGGCFHNPAIDSVVTGHRMAFAVSAERTVLWDQIKYTGDPGDFGWVLPVAPGATIELSNDAFFEALEAATSTQVSPPQLACAQNDSSGCFGSSSSASAGVAKDARGSGPGVSVLHEGSLGPFETVTLRSTDSGSLRDWLTSHNYAIQSDVDPIIDAYIMEGMDFIALRLRGDQPMQPVRVVTPRGDAVLPLRMVMAGTGSDVDVVLYVIAEDRAGLADLTEVSADMKKLTYDFAASTTNWPKLRADALAQNLGASFLTTFAAKNAFARSTQRLLQTTGGQLTQSLADLYFKQGQETAQTMVGAATMSCSLAQTGFSSDALVTDASASQFTCAGLSDLSAAMIGMHPSRVWLSRLEMDLPRDVLGMDCHLDSASKQEEVSSDVTAAMAKNRPPACEQAVFESRISRGERLPARLGFAWAMAGLGAAALLRRLRGRPS